MKLRAFLLMLICATPVQGAQAADDWEMRKKAVKKECERFVMNAIRENRDYTDPESCNYADYTYRVWVRDFLCDAAVEHRDASFVRFLLSHGADADVYTDPPYWNRRLLNVTQRLPIAIALIAHGANVHWINRHGDTVLHTIDYSSPDAAHLALLYYAAGADPRAVGELSFTPLMRIALDISQSKLSSNNLQRFKNGMELAATLVRIGVPVDTRITSFRSGFPIDNTYFARGDDIRALLKKGSEEAHSSDLVKQDIATFKHLLDKEQKEVAAANVSGNKRDRLLHKALLQMTPLDRDVCPLVVAYAKQHALPPSTLADVKKVREEVVLFEQQYAAETNTQAEKGCVIS